MFERALELERAGRSIVHMEIGRPHLQSPDCATEAAVRALRAGATHYTANRGLPELRAAISEKVEERTGLAYDPDTEVVVTAGGSEAVAAAMMVALDQGDEAIVLDPAWPHYAAHIALAGAVPVHVPCAPSEGFLPDLDRLRAAVGPKTRVLVVSSPSNPTGAVFPEGTLAALAELCGSRDLLVVSDEIYERFVYDGHAHLSLAAMPGMRQRTIVVNSFSKTYSMTGWRVGYALAPAQLADQVNTIHQYLTVCAPSFAQAGALAALREGEHFIQDAIGEFAERRSALIDGLADIEGIELAEPAGAFYAFPRIDMDPPRGSASPAMALLEEAGVAVVGGGVFGAGLDDHVRLSYAVSEAELEDGITRIRGFVDRAG